ncbi:hypothetical protein CEXT_574431 [Caerostris extrusa]|uniref:Uncharacterized protein n=1 Tax=Caerostris extrusa TaxID=172846 RepID=A0AAV4XYK2_CAEEX|nr:hypothetical protein CEXT_574431 [Caerostris extrusa]
MRLHFTDICISEANCNGEALALTFTASFGLGIDIREDISARSSSWSGRCIHNLWISGILSEFITARGALPPWISIWGAGLLATVEHGLGQKES